MPKSDTYFKKGNTASVGRGRTVGKKSKKTLIKEQLLREQVQQEMGIKVTNVLNRDAQANVFLKMYQLGVKEGNVRALNSLADRIEEKKSAVAITTNDVTDYANNPVRHVVEVVHTDYDSKKDPEAVSYE